MPSVVHTYPLTTPPFELDEERSRLRAEQPGRAKLTTEVTDTAIVVTVTTPDE